MEGERGRFQAVFLAMGRDRANGRLALSPAHGRAGGAVGRAREPAAVPHAGTALPGHRAGAGRARRLQPAVGAAAPAGSGAQPGRLRDGGGAAYGVLGPGGQVHRYPGLYVFDGAALPSSIGVNPSSTIAAVAERNVEQRHPSRCRAPRAGHKWPCRARSARIRQLYPRGRRGCRFGAVEPRPGASSRYSNPLGTVVIPAGGTVASPTPVVGLRFTERMSGPIPPGHVPADDFTGAEKAGQRAGERRSSSSPSRSPNLDRFLAEEAHGGIAQGTVHVRGLTPPRGRGRGERRLQPLRGHRALQRAADALPAALHRRGRPAVPFPGWVQGGAGRRRLRRVERHVHALHGDAPGYGALSGPWCPAASSACTCRTSSSKLTTFSCWARDAPARSRRTRFGGLGHVHGPPLGRLRSREVRLGRTAQRGDGDAIRRGGGGLRLRGFHHRARLAQAGRSVAVLERGRRYAPGFPATSRARTSCSGASRPGPRRRASSTCASCPASAP